MTLGDLLEIFRFLVLVTVTGAVVLGLVTLYAILNIALELVEWLRHRLRLRKSKLGELGRSQRD